MTTMLVTIQYGFTPEDKVTHKMYFQSGDTSNKTGGDGALNLDGTGTISDGAPINSGRGYILNYLECLRLICQPGVQVFMANAEQFDETDWSSHTVIHTASQDILNFAAATGNLPAAGPRGRAFIGARQSIAATHRYGWMRWHYIAGNLMHLPTLIPVDSMPGTFAGWFGNLRSLGSSLPGYATLTAALDAELLVTPKDLPSSVLHFGLRNG